MGENIMSILEMSSSKDSFTLTKNYLTLDIETCQNEVFREKGFTIIKDFISKDAAIIIKKLLLKNDECFSKGSEEGNHRLFIYPNSPYTYPTVLMQLYEYISVIKNVITSLFLILLSILNNDIILTPILIDAIHLYVSNWDASSFK